MNTGQKYVQLTVDLAIRASGGGWDTENDQINCKLLAANKIKMSIFQPTKYKKVTDEVYAINLPT